MDNIVKSVEQALESNNYFGALFIAVCIPDICGKIEFNSSNQHYKDWFDKYMPEIYKQHVPGGDAYAIRCALLHEASGSLGNQRAREVLDNYLFTYTGNHLNTFNNTNGDKIRQCVLDYTTYCMDIITSFRKWQATTLEQDDKVKARYIESEKIRLQTDVADAIPGVKFN